MNPSERIQQIAERLVEERFPLTGYPGADLERRDAVTVEAILEYLDEEHERRAKWEQTVEERIGVLEDRKWR